MNSIRLLLKKIKVVDNDIAELFDWYIHERKTKEHCCSTEKFFNKKYKKLKNKRMVLEKHLHELVRHYDDLQK
jgi:septation ring formation regulator EzrA